MTNRFAVARSDRRRALQAARLASHHGSLVYLPLVLSREESAVKPGIHPNYEEVAVRCACGNTFTTRSTKTELHLDICSACHPFFTGRQKLLDTEGRVERFTKRFGAQSAAAVKEAARVTKAAKASKSKKPSATA
jgi:large subunit ribosomal protein L31